MTSEPVVARLVAHWRKTRPMAPTQQLGGRPVAEDFLTLWKLLDMLAGIVPADPLDPNRHERAALRAFEAAVRSAESNPDERRTLAEAVDAARRRDEAEQ